MARRVVVWGLALIAVATLIVAAGAVSGVLDETLTGRPAEPAQRPGPAQAQAFPPSSTNAARKASPYVLRPAMGAPPVEVEFENEPAAGILFDVDSGEVLWEHDSGERRPIASLTKMMTALVVAQRHGPGEDVAITPEALAYEGSGMGVLPKGREVELETLLRGLILVSGNDAAIALAQHDAGSVDDFVRRMNRAREKYGLTCSRFTSPHGLQDRGNYSCARDLAALARADLDNRRIAGIMATDQAHFPFPIKGGFLDLYNNNPFIRNGTAGITGVKTGYTDAAGRCYVTTQRVGDRHLGVVLLDSPKPLEQVPALLRAGARRG
jgi:serine-type D-Ala-D-Ala carboxypeptidase (penicillin-binding protein 5/6)